MNAASAEEDLVMGPDTSLNILAEGIATLLFLIFGLVYYFYFYYHHKPIPSPSPSVDPTSRFILFVKHVISDHETVLFVTSEAYVTPFQLLYNALQTPLYIVNLAQTAGGAKVLDVLRERFSKEVSNDFLFVRGQLIGGSKELRNLLIKGRKDELGDKCDWTHVRVDSTMDTGFMVLDALTSFQSVEKKQKEEKTRVMLETKPLHTPQQLCSFNVTNLVKCCVPMALHARNPRRRSKLLVCHDMKGGYLGDRFKQGCDDFDAYRFYQWDLVDVFVYFGHALVCPPPCGWIAAGHRHGTRVLGTFLTEGDDGTERCKEVFQNAQSAETFAIKLAAIACHGGFDGWLINIENDVPSELVVHLDLFLCILQKELHLLNPRAQIVWYGSLSRSGKRSSYVRLDECSADFFRHVNGFYADYGWRSDDAKFSAAFDLDRRYDVYMGIDVFGRHNMLGGGKMNCSEPLRVARNAGVSAALFAPGWTYECGQYEEKEELVVVENRFWSAIRESWKVKGPCFDALGGRNCLYTAFNVGRGKGVWLEGSRVGSSPWSNLTELDIQPDHALHAGKTLTTALGYIKAVISHDTAFHGGASVQLQGQLMDREKAYFKLYDVDIELSSRRTMEISYTIATRDDSVCLLVLTVCPGFDRATHYIILRSMDEDSDLGVHSRHSDNTKTLSKLAKASKEKHFYLPICTEHFNVNIGNGDAVQGMIENWCKKTYRLGGQLWNEKHIVEIGVLCTQKKRKAFEEQKDFLAFVGEVCVIGNSSKSDANAVHQGVHSQPKACKDVRITFFERNSFDLVSFEVQWAFTSEGVPVRYVVVFACTQGGERIYVGKSFDNSLWVENCQSEETTDSSNYLTLELQSVSWAGQCGTDVCRLFIDENTRL